jgi:hypothetical protein
MRKTIIVSGIIAVLIALTIVGITYFPGSTDKPAIQTFETKQNPAFKAVPLKSPLVIEVKNQSGFYEAIKGGNAAFAELRGIPEADQLFSNIAQFRDFVSGRSGIRQLLEGKSVVISVNPTGKNKLTNLFLVQLNDQDEANSATDVVSRELGAEFSISRRSYDNSTIFSAKSPKQQFFFACANSIFMASDDFILVEEAIRHSNSQNLLSNNEFATLYKTIGETALANVFINHKYIQLLLARLVSPEVRKTIGQTASYSNWTNFDLSTSSSDLELSGYSFTKDSSDHFLNIFKGQEAQKFTIDQAIPSNAAFFVALNIKNPSQFLNVFESYIKANGYFYPREMSLIEFQKKTKTDAVQLIKDLGASQYAGVYTSINKSDPTQNRFFVAELKSQSEAKTKLLKAVSEYSKTSKINETELRTSFASGSKKSFDIYQLPIANMAESLFGKSFSGINGKYFTLYDKYIIWGDNLPGMKNYIESLVTQKTMANDSIYKVYLKNGQPRPNYFMYAKVPKVFRLKDVFLKPALSAQLANSEDHIRKFSAFIWQFSVSGKMVKNNLSLKYAPNMKEDPEAIWQIKIDAPLAQKPTFVLNHRDLANREIIVTDKLNNIYLINKDGVILWKLNLPEPIISDIHLIDIYQTKRFQYLFNTKSQLYVVDRTGSKVGKYPVNLKAMASNGVSVSEFGKNREYRFFVAGEDKKVYVYDRDGKLIPKWNFEGSESLVTKSISHYFVDGKTHIVFSDQKNTYFLDWQGKNREIQPGSFDRSSNQMTFINDGNPKLISTDQTGKIHLQDFTGQTEIKEVGKFGSSHRFAAEDIDGNGSVEYLFAEGKKLTVFSLDGKKLFERSFPQPISEAPFVCSFGPGVFKIGVVTEGENQIYLLNSNGVITRGFPQPGNTSFVLGKFNDSATYFNLLVGSNDGNLVNYKVE